MYMYVCIGREPVDPEHDGETEHSAEERQIPRETLELGSAP